MTTSTVIAANTLLLCVAIPFWKNVAFEWELLYIGFFCGTVNVIGMIFVQEAYFYGPAGPVAAIVVLSYLLSVILEGLRTHKMISTFELISMLFGFFGAMVLAIPEILAKYCFCCCSKKTKSVK